MNREIYISYDTNGAPCVNGWQYNPKDEIFAGFDEESGATKLNINLPSDWSGTFYIGLKPYNGDMEFTSVGTDTKIEYELPSQSAGLLTMQIKAVGDSTIITDPIYFEIR